jgi:hypothetical protein
MILDLYYTNHVTDVTISAFGVIGDYPYVVRMSVGCTTIRDNRFKTKEEALRDFMWLVSNSILNEENV